MHFNTNTALYDHWLLMRHKTITMLLHVFRKETFPLINTTKWRLIKKERDDCNMHHLLLLCLLKLLEKLVKCIFFNSWMIGSCPTWRSLPCFLKWHQYWFLGSVTESNLYLKCNNLFHNRTQIHIFNLKLKHILFYIMLYTRYTTICSSIRHRHKSKTLFSLFTCT